MLAAEYFAAEFQGEELCFVVGHRGDFDTYATMAMSVVKGALPGIKLWQLIAYYNPVKPHFTIDEIDETYFPLGLETVPKPYAIVKANNYVVSICDAVICYVNREGSNTYKLLRKAQRRGIPIVNLAETYPPPENGKTSERKLRGLVILVIRLHSGRSAGTRLCPRGYSCRHRHPPERRQKPCRFL